MPTQTDRQPWEPAYSFTATNDKDPHDLAAALELVRRCICGYGPNATTCDCKYGAGSELTNPEGRYLNSEQTGCPELREVIHKLLHRGTPGEIPTETEERLTAEVDALRQQVRRAAQILGAPS
jgi:hypothetical protein